MDSVLRSWIRVLFSVSWFTLNFISGIISLCVLSSLSFPGRLVDTLVSFNDIYPVGSDSPELNPLVFGLISLGLVIKAE